jgi:hypothetical protein
VKTEDLVMIEAPMSESSEARDELIETVQRA